MLSKFIQILSLGFASVALAGDFADPKEVYAKVQEKTAVMVDVRNADEIAAGMAADALWLPLPKLLEDPANFDALNISKDTEVFFYCRSGRRSAIAAEAIAKRGYKTGNMGAFSDYVAAGLPVKKPEPSND